jgi:glycosyltransferase involved in cell wall biosynthesis
MPEICANAALYFDPDDPEDIAGKMEQLIFEDPLRKKLASAAKERCAHFSWDRTARQTIDFLKEAGQKR